MKLGYCLTRPPFATWILLLLHADATPSPSRADPAYDGISLAPALLPYCPMGNTHLTTSLIPVETPGLWCDLACVWPGLGENIRPFPETVSTVERWLASLLPALFSMNTNGIICFLRFYTKNLLWCYLLFCFLHRVQSCQLFYYQLLLPTI